MTEKKSEKKGMKASTKAGIGFGLTAAAATMAGAYFLYGSKKAAQNRKKVKSWTLKAKAQVLEGLEKAEQLTDDEYNNLVEAASGVYGTVKNATKGEVVDFKKEMLSHWKDLQKSSALKKLVAPAIQKAIVKKVVAKKKPTKSVAVKPKAKKVTTSTATPAV
jgi:hypothetical protein